VHSPFREARGTPIQPVYAGDAQFEMGGPMRTPFCLIGSSSITPEAIAAVRRDLAELGQAKGRT